MFKLPKLTKKERAWVLYDIANSAFVLTVITVLFPILYETVFAQAENIAHLDKVIEVNGVKEANAAYGDVWARGSQIFKYLTIIGGFGLAIPGLSWVVLLVIFTISSIGYNLTNVVYDAFLVDVTGEEKMDEISAQGFAWGYIGSLIPFFIGIIPYALATFGIIPEEFTTLTISFAFVVSLVWWWVYSQPILNDVEQTFSIDQTQNSLGKSFKRLWVTLKEIRSFKYIFIFLIAYLLYIDVVNSVIRLAVNIGSDLFVSAPVMLGVIVMVQIIAFPSAIIYGRLTKKHGGKKMIYYGIFIYAIGVYVVTLIQADSTYLMWVVGALIGTAQGGIQSVSRSYFAKMVPYEKANDFFGFFSVFGRFGGIISPFIIAYFSGRMETGVNGAVMLLMIPLAIASILLFFVNPPKNEEIYISE